MKIETDIVTVSLDGVRVASALIPWEATNVHVSYTVPDPPKVKVKKEGWVVEERSIKETKDAAIWASGCGCDNCMAAAKPVKVTYEVEE